MAVQGDFLRNCIMLVQSPRFTANAAFVTVRAQTRGFMEDDDFEDMKLLMNSQPNAAWHGPHQLWTFGASGLPAFIQEVFNRGGRMQSVIWRGSVVRSLLTIGLMNRMFNVQVAKASRCIVNNLSRDHEPHVLTIATLNTLYIFHLCY